MKIAIVKLSALGDIIHASIVLQFIKKHFNDAIITWFVDEKFSQIIECNEIVNEVVKIPLKDKKFIKTYEILKKYKNTFDVVIDMQGLIKSAIVARILSKNCIGFDKFSTKESLAGFFYKKALNCDYNENIIIRNLNLASFALNFSYTKDEILNKQRCFKVYEFNIKNISKNKKNILIAPFSSDASKNYARLKEVINAFCDENVLICHGSKQELENAKILAQNTNAKVLDSLRICEMIYLISNIDLVIGNDSGITHLAWAQNTPSITLFGNRPSKRNAYETKINKTIDANRKIDARKIDKNNLCINEIPPEKIINQAKELLYENS